MSDFINGSPSDLKKLQVFHILQQKVSPGDLSIDKSLPTRLPGALVKVVPAPGGGVAIAPASYNGAAAGPGGPGLFDCFGFRLFSFRLFFFFCSPRRAAHAPAAATVAKTLTFPALFLSLPLYSPPSPPTEVTAGNAAILPINKVLAPSKTDIQASV